MNLIARLLPVLKSEFEKKRGGNHERQDFEDTKLSDSRYL